MLEEALESVDATIDPHSAQNRGRVEADFLDACLDSLGVIALSMSLMEKASPGCVATAMNEYEESQKRRNRPKLPHRNVLQTVARTISGSSIDDSVEKLITAVFKAKAKKEGWK